jgi:hypothetical protein
MNVTPARSRASSGPQRRITPQQLIPQFGGGLDVDLPPDLDYQRGTGPDGHAQVRRLGAVRNSRSRLPPGIGAGQILSEEEA